VKTLKQRIVVTAVLLAVASPLVLVLHYSAPAPADIGPLKQRIPKVIGAWAMESEHGPTEEETRILETDAILTRTYVHTDGRRADLSVIFARDNRRVAHPPEICYKGSGWEVMGRAVAELQVEGETFRANQRLLIRGGHRLLVLYWYKAGANYTANYWWMQCLIIKSHVLNRQSSSALIRVSAPSSSAAEDKDVVQTLREFATIAIPPVTQAIEGS
jgi:EpsI family protein